MQIVSNGYRTARRAQRDMFQLGWTNALRLARGLPLYAFGCGPKRNRQYVYGWTAARALITAMGGL